MTNILIAAGTTAASALLLVFLAGCALIIKAGMFLDRNS